jgi:hypothetical protein
LDIPFSEEASRKKWVTDYLIRRMFLDGFLERNLGIVRKSKDLILKEMNY